MSFMYAATDRHPQLALLALAQVGVLHRRQFVTCDVSRRFVDAQVTAERWTAVGEQVVLLQNASPTRSQLMWIAVLDAQPPAALGSHTALALAGFEPFAAEAERIHLIVTR